jgi:hypothetical protein
MVGARAGAAPPCRPAHVEVRWIDARSGYMRAFQDAVTRDPDHPKITLYNDVIEGFDREYFVGADDRDTLWAYAQGLARAGVRVPDGDILVVEPGFDDAKPPHPVYHLHLVNANSVLDDRAFASVAVQRWGDKVWYVAVTLTAAGKTAWARETRRWVNTRALVLVDRDVVSELPVAAPVRDGILPIFTASRDAADALSARLSASCP